MSDRATAIRRKFPRFRVLVVGRANAGKTTLLQRVCKTNELPIIHNKDGDEIDANHGEEHDIEHEISFKSNVQFVFHDSHGFEAGGADELWRVQSFIQEHARERKLADQLHAIWYCIPMNEHSRPIIVAEDIFFSTCGTGNVVAILTKFDALDVVAFGELTEQGMGYEEALEMCSQHAKEMFRKNDYSRTSHSG